MSIFSSSKKLETVLILDIGSGSVGGVFALIDPKQKKKPTIVHAIRADILYQQTLDGERFHQSMLEALKRVLSGLHELNFGQPTRVYCFLAAPWYASQTREIMLSRGTTFTFSKSFANALFEKEIRAFEQEHLAVFREKNDDMRLFEKRITDIRLDGVTLSEPFGKKAKEVSMSVFVAIAGEQLVHNIEYHINKFFHAPKVVFGSFQGAAHLTLRTLFPTESNLLIADIGGEVTDMGFVRDDNIAETITFPIGKHDIVRRIAKQFSVTLHEAEALLSLYYRGALEKRFRTQVERTVEYAQLMWIRAFKRALLAKKESLLTIPEKMFLFSDVELAQFYTDACKHKEMKGILHSEKNKLVLSVQAPLFADRVRVPMSEARDPFLMLETTCVSLFSNML